MKFLERYLQGEYLDVWEELSELEENVYTIMVKEEMQQIVAEMMQRVRFNIEMLITKLPEIGYTFGYHWIYELELSEEERTNLLIESSKQPPLYIPPNAYTLGKVLELERLVGPLPLVLKGWYEIVGGVNFIGKAPSRWKSRSMDIVNGLFYQNDATKEEESQVSENLLQIHDIDPLFIYDAEYTLQQQREKTPLFSFYRTISLAPDEDFKYFSSGGGDYCIEIPNPKLDPFIIHEWHNTSFVNYLRICFQWGGLPGIATWQIPEEDLLFLRSGLLEF